MVHRRPSRSWAPGRPCIPAAGAARAVGVSGHALAVMAAAGAGGRSAGHTRVDARVDARVGGDAGPRRHAPSEQVWFAEQTEQLLPSSPHASSSVPLRHVPASSQQPSQLEGWHCPSPQSAHRKYQAGGKDESKCSHRARLLIVKVMSVLRSVRGSALIWHVHTFGFNVGTGFVITTSGPEPGEIKAL